jgi:hypothetical protein
MSRVPLRTIAIVLAIFALIGGVWILAGRAGRDDLPLASPQDDLLPAEVLSDVRGNFAEDEILLESDTLESEDDSDNEYLQEAFFPNLGENPEVFEGDLDGYLILGKLGDPGTIDGAYLPNRPDELLGLDPDYLATDDPSQQSGLLTADYPGLWITGTSAFLSSTDMATRNVLYNDTEFGCGETNGRHRTICASGGPIESDQPTNSSPTRWFSTPTVTDATTSWRNPPSIGTPTRAPTTGSNSSARTTSGDSK